ncbi:hypothetical protein [Streptomyces beihaiensis]|uniref:Uncharacterized protein n=1 Tax=Streptomyces beihaiensis TaxID=2984495 RepID=A0ABT3TRC7_9ACTN|nr:hypothetical protein [Streptomyces beihaiensis]MCX3059589.1 hypothetical protein [Streptomyces beihaiensis]
MICRPCMEAADGVPGARHCDETGGPSWACACQHRTDRHSTAARGPADDSVTTTLVVRTQPDAPLTAEAVRDIHRRGVGRR